MALGCRRNRCLGTQVYTDNQALAHTQPEGHTGDTPLEGILQSRCRERHARGVHVSLPQLSDWDSQRFAGQQQ